MSLAYVVDDVFAEHRPPTHHPERPERIAAVRAALKAAGLERRGTRLPTRAATAEEIGRVHTAGYVAELEKVVRGRDGWLDPDTYFSTGTWEAVCAAAGAVVDLTSAVLSGRFGRGLAVVRPPGHHAEADRAMGFCMVNNVAVAAAAARAEGAARVAIVDWDVHHGNGTQHMFYDDASIMYVSCHQSPFYPGTGHPEEIGAGDAAGTTVNVAFPGGLGDADYVAAFDEVFVPAIERFAPDVILVSAGFDAYVGDPLAGMRLSRAGFRAIARRVLACADRVCEGRVVAALEGGYDLAGLGDGMTEVLDALDPAPADDAEAAAPAQPTAPGRRAIAATRTALGWSASASEEGGGA